MHEVTEKMACLIGIEPTAFRLGVLKNSQNPIKISNFHTFLGVLKYFSSKSANSKDLRRLFLLLFCTSMHSFWGYVPTFYNPRKQARTVSNSQTPIQNYR